MKFLFAILLTINLFGASVEQVDKYMSLSNATEDIISIGAKTDNILKMYKVGSSYDVGLFEQRYKKKISELLSDSEMEEILSNYKNLLYARLVHEVSREDNDEDAAAKIYKFYKNLENTEDGLNRIKYTKEITNNIYKEEILEDMITKLIDTLKVAKNVKRADMEKMKKNVVKTMIKSIARVMTYRLQDLSIQELKGLAKFTKKSSVYNEQKVSMQALLYAIDDYLKVISTEIENKYNKKQSKR